MARRREPDDPRAVEFVEPGESPAPVEESSSKRGGNQRWYLLLSGAVLVVVALLVGRTGDDDPAAPVPSTSVPSTSAPAAPSASAPPALDPADCPGLQGCPASPEFPTAGAAALRHEFPRTSPGSALTVRLPDGRLWFRQLTARAGPLVVTVRIQQDGAATALQPDRVHAVSYVRQAERGYVVQIQVEGPLRDIPQIDRLYRLAADLRLFGQG